MKLLREDPTTPDWILDKLVGWEDLAVTERDKVCRQLEAAKRKHREEDDPEASWAQLVGTPSPFKGTRKPTIGHCGEIDLPWAVDGLRGLPEKAAAGGSTPVHHQYHSRLTLPPADFRRPHHPPSSTDHAMAEVAATEGNDQLICRERLEVEMGGGVYAEHAGRSSPKGTEPQ